MLDSIYIGMSGLQGYSRGLKVIANNTANINTPGYKGSSLQFSDMFYSNSGTGGNASGTFGQVGHGLVTNGTTLNFKQGELRQTGNSLDLAIDGEGLFTLKGANGELTYTRAGQFEFNSDGVLVNRVDGSKVMAMDGSGNFVEITTNGNRANGAKATTNIVFSGNVPAGGTTQTINSVKVVDSNGAEHTLTVTLTNTNATTPGSWRVDVLDGATNVGTGQIIFDAGKPTSATAKLNINYTPAGLTAMPLQLDFSKDVTSLAPGSLQAIGYVSNDGFVSGALSGVSFDAAGILVFSYTNGQTVKSNKLALARFDSTDDVEAVGSNQFKATSMNSWHRGTATTNGFGTIRSGQVEISNVDLSQEFSDLVIMQRGYQASSQIVTTANEMLQELFSMKGK